jgi:Family of unknown function (DUF5947)
VTTWGAGTPAQGNPKAVNAAETTGLRRFVKRPSGTRRVGSEPPGARPARVIPTTSPAAGGQPAGVPAQVAPSAAADVYHDPDVYTDPGGRLTLGANDREPGTDASPEPDRCQLCNIQLDGRHGHLVDTDKRSLACACRACYLLFTHQGAGAGGRYRAVPERICHDPARPLTDAEWGELDIPVAMAFFFFNSALGRVVAGYPSPGGPTECELDLEAWDRLAAGHPLFAAMTPDVEAIFVNRTDLGNEVFLIPIDMCYSLVGELRMLWQGFDGGAEVRTALATFLTGVRKRARVLTPQLASQDVEY